METVYRSDRTGHQVQLVRGNDGERLGAEEELLKAGVPLMLMHRALWSGNRHMWETWFLLVRDAQGIPCAGAALEVVQTRALPVHRILRLPRFGGGLSGQVCRAILDAAIVLAKQEKYALRIEVQAFSRDHRGELIEALGSAGFTEIRPPASYRHTLAVDLRPSEEEIFAAFSKSARTRIRETTKKGFLGCKITDPVYAERMMELLLESLQRTGGHTPTEDMHGILSMSEKFPDLSAVFALFISDDLAPENMAAFTWVCSHGDHAEYRTAGSTRKFNTRIPFGYLLVWEMIRWAKSAGAQWFDMGGVTLADEGQTTLEGISDFKQFFTRDLLEVGSEWVLEVAPIRSSLASMISQGTLRVRELLGRAS